MEGYTRMSHIDCVECRVASKGRGRRGEGDLMDTLSYLLNFERGKYITYFESQI